MKITYEDRRTLRTDRDRELYQCAKDLYSDHVRVDDEEIDEEIDEYAETMIDLTDEERDQIKDYLFDMEMKGIGYDY